MVNQAFRTNNPTLFPSDPFKQLIDKQMQASGAANTIGQNITWGGAPGAPGGNTMNGGDRVFYNKAAGGNLGPPAPTNRKAPDGRFLDQYGVPFGPMPTVTSPTDNAANNIAKGLPPQTPAPPGAAGVATGANSANAGVRTGGSAFALPAGWDESGNKYSFDVATNSGWTNNPGEMLYRLGYNPNKDGAKIDVGRGPNQRETEFNRVYGWMNAVAKANGVPDISMASPEMQQYATNYAVGRLRTDSFNLDPSGRTWQASSFAGFDGRLRTTPAPGAPAAPGAPGTSGAPGATNGAPPPGGGSTVPPAATSGTSGTNGGDGLASNAAGRASVPQKLMLANDPNTAYDYMMQQLGYDPSAPGMLGKFLEKKFKPMMQARMAASGLEGSTVGADGQLVQNKNYMDNIDQLINGFGGAISGQGDSQNFFGNMATIGSDAARNASGTLGQLQDQSQAMQYLQQLGSLRFAGDNPMIQQANADVMQRGQSAYERYAFNNEGNLHNIDPFTKWLQEQSQYRGIYGI